MDRTKVFRYTPWIERFGRDVTCKISVHFIELVQHYCTSTSLNNAEIESDDAGFRCNRCMRTDPQSGLSSISNRAGAMINYEGSRGSAPLRLWSIIEDSRLSPRSWDSDPHFLNRSAVSETDQCCKTAGPTIVMPYGKVFCKQSVFLPIILHQ